MGLDSHLLTGNWEKNIVAEAEVAEAEMAEAETETSHRDMYEKDMYEKGKNYVFLNFKQVHEFTCNVTYISHLFSSHDIFL